MNFGSPKVTRLANPQTNTIESMKQYSATKIKNVNARKITYEESDKKRLLKLSKDYFDGFRLEKKLEEKEFDLTQIKLASSQLKINKNGFKNDYVYCYLNVVIQALLSVHPILQYFVKPDEVQDENSKISKKISSGKYCSKFKKILDKNCSIELNTINITELLVLFKSSIDLQL